MLCIAKPVIQFYYQINYTFHEREKIKPVVAKKPEPKKEKEAAKKILSVLDKKGNLKKIEF